MAMYNEITVTAELTNTEYMITKNYNLLQNKPQINSVELMGNKSLEDLGINPDAEENVIDVVKVNGSALTPDANKAVNVTVTTGSDNGTVKVNGSDVAVKGLKSAAFTEATAYDAAGSAAEVQGNVDALTVVVNGKVDKVQGKGLSQNDFTNAYKTKLDGIEAGAQVNTVTSVAGKTGAVNLSKSDVGLGNVDNTSDLNKPISTATQTALDGKVDKVEGKGLSTEDFTAEEKTKLAGIEDGAEVNVQADWNQTDVNADDYIKNKPEIGDAAYAEHLALTTPINNNAPYLFRAFPVRNAFKENLKSIVGGTVVWNQLVALNTSIWNNTDANVTVSGRKFTVTATASNDGLKFVYFNLIKGHIYYCRAKCIGVTNSAFVGVYNGHYGNSTTYTVRKGCAAGETATVEFISNAPYDDTTFRLLLPTATQQNGYSEFEDVVLIDLTQMFGSTIADYIYSLEQATAGRGVAYFRSLFPKDYYAYNAGQLMSVKALSHNTVGFNQFDKSTATTGKYIKKDGTIGTDTAFFYSDYIRVLPNIVYHFKRVIGTSSLNYSIFEYDSNKTLIGSYGADSGGNVNAGGKEYNYTTTANVYYLRFNGAKNYIDDTCLNLHWDGERDGEYEAYEKRSYPLDSDLELRGIPKLDANNQLYYDGDTYESDGTVTRKYGYRAYQSGDESLADAITDGTNTVYKLATPTTETADTFTNPQLVDNWGTEEFVDNRDVPIPVGHDTDFTQEIHIASLPTADGTYNATLTMSNGIATMSFVSTS